MITSLVWSDFKIRTENYHSIAACERHEAVNNPPPLLLLPESLSTAAKLFSLKVHDVKWKSTIRVQSLIIFAVVSGFEREVKGTAQGRKLWRINSPPGAWKTTWIGLEPHSPSELSNDCFIIQFSFDDSFSALLSPLKGNLGEILLPFRRMWIRMCGRNCEWVIYNMFHCRQGSLFAKVERNP